MGSLLDKFEALARMEEPEEENDKENDGSKENEEEEAPMSLEQELRFYVAAGDEKKISELCKTGADINAPDLPTIMNITLDDDSAKSPKSEKLYDVADPITGDYPLHIAAEHNYVNIVSQLFYLGAIMENKSRIGSTALHRAVGMNNLEVTAELLKLGADIHAVNVMGNTALHIACCCSHLSMIELLLDNGAAADLTAKNKVHMTPIMYTQRKSAERKLLLERDSSLSRFLQDENDALGDDEDLVNGADTVVEDDDDAKDQ